MERVKTTWDYVMLVIAILLAGTVFARYAEASENNDAMRACLLAHNYDGQVLNMYNFGPASRCYHDWKSGQLSQEYIKSKMWLEEHPWYTGSNWNWEEVARKYPGKENVKRY